MNDEITIRLSEKKDQPYLVKWLLEQGVLKWFPMCNEREVVESVKVIMGFVKIRASLTAEINGEPCGCAYLNLSPFKKMKHQCLLTILVTEKYRGRGIGTRLMHDLEKLAKEKFHMTMLHLEVYGGNPAYSLYKRLGYKEFGRHEHFLKEESGEYITKIMMEKEL